MAGPFFSTAWQPDKSTAGGHLLKEKHMSSFALKMTALILMLFRPYLPIF